MTINPFSKHFGGLNEGGGIESFEGSFERKTREKKRGAMLCASVTVTPQSIDTTLDSLSFFLSFFLPLSYALVVSGWSLSGWTHLYTHTYIFIYFFSVRMTSSSRWWHYIQVNESPFRHQFQKRVYKIILDMKKKILDIRSTHKEMKG